MNLYGKKKVTNIENEKYNSIPRIKKILKNEYFRDGIILFLIISLFFLPVFLKGWIIFPDLLSNYRPWRGNIQEIPFNYSELKSDYIDGTFPYIKIAKESLFSMKLPQWNEFADLGKPFVTATLNLVFFPLNIFYWLFPIGAGFTLSIIIKAFLGSLGFYLWLRSLKISRSVSIMSSVVFVFAGFNNSWLLDAASTVNLMAPWVFLLIDKIHKSKNSKIMLAYTLVLSIVISLLITAGFISGAGYVIYLSSFYILMLIIIKFFSEKPYTINKFLLAIKPGIFILLSIIIGVGISAIFSLPALEWVNQMGFEYRKETNAKEYLPLKSLWQLVFPNYWGNPITKNWHGYSNWSESSSYFTIILLSMVPFSLIKTVSGKSKKMKLFFIFMLFCFLMIWGITPLLSIIGRLPIFDSSSSVRLLGLFSFFAITIAAWGLEKVFQKQSTKLAVILVGIFTGALSIFGVSKLGVLLKSGILSSATLFNPEIFRMITILVGIIILFAFFVTLFHWDKGCISKKTFTFIIGVLLVFDIGYFSFGQTPMVPEEYFYPDTEITGYLSENIGNGRILVFDGQFMISGSQLFYGIDTALTHNMHTSREKEIVALFSQDAWATPVAPMLKSASTDFSSPVFEYYGIKYVVVDPSVDIEDASWLLVVDNQVEGRVYENLEYVDSKYWVTYDNRELTSKEDFFSNINKVANREYSYIEDTDYIPEISEQTKVDIEVITDKAELNEIRVCTDAPGILNVRESFWPGWNVKVNGKEAELLKVNYLYRGVLLDSGCSIVIEEFKPESFKFGSIISLASLSVVFLLGGGLFFSKVSKKKLSKKKIS